MKSAEKSVRLAEILRQLADRAPQDFEEFCNMFLNLSYADFDDCYGLSDISIKTEECLALPVFRGPYIAEVLLWGPDAYTPVFDFRKFKFRIMVLQGAITKVRYRKNETYLDYDGVDSWFCGQRFQANGNFVQSLLNNFYGRSVTLNLYDTSEFNLSDIRVFDTLQRKVFQLSGGSFSCPWYQPDALTAT